MRNRMTTLAELLLVIVVTCLALGVIASTFEALLVPISKPGCEEKCGNVSVPFPFGMGSSNCFLDEWFEIVCNKNVNPPTLLLKRTQLEVLNISWDDDGYYSRYDDYSRSSRQVLVIKSPFSFFNCGNKGEPKTVDLTGAPFSFSDKNVFVAVSCGVHAKMDSSSGDTLSQIGCKSKCSLRDNTTAASNHDNVLCNGIGCCQTSINSIVDSFKITFDNSTTAEGEISDQCKFAFVVDQNFWYDFQNQSSSFARIRDKDYVPVILEWYLTNYSYFEIFQRNMPEKRKLTNPYCYDSTSYYSFSTNANPRRLQCSCGSGLRGNPYLSEGCSQDINECVEYYNFELCGSGGTCVNTFGGYHCSYKRKFLFIASFPIYHRDIKSTNILLDEKYRAKIADFGTSRTISLEQTHLTTLVYGTFGYLDPEYFQSSQFTEKSDVYSFGVVLIELLTGQKAICATRAEEGRNLATYFAMSMEANHLFDIVDAKILEDGTREEILIVACVALRCLSLSGRNRPTMKEVAMELEGLQKSEKEAPSNYQQHYEEIKYIRTELIEPWDAASTSTGSSAFDNTRASLQQELPLLSFESK